MSAPGIAWSAFRGFFYWDREEAKAEQLERAESAFAIADLPIREPHTCSECGGPLVLTTHDSWECPCGMAF